jgi:SPP1 gp7 family putative phage head morphogenesis protein
VRRRNPNEVVLRPVRANVGLECAYRKKLVRMVEFMHKSVLYWVCAAYRAHEPVLAQDASPAIELRDAVRALARRWIRNFNLAAPRLARYFATAICDRNTRDLDRILEQGGFSVRLKMTPAMRDVFQATLAANVGLIRTIPQQYLGQVEQMVARSVQTGRDLQQLTRDIEGLKKVTRNRAVLIARDQNQKATSAMQEARRLELGITEAVWLHSHGGKKPRPTHLKNHGKRYQVAQGWYDPDPRVRRHIHPGELINCRCVSRSVIPGFV